MSEERFGKYLVTGTLGRGAMGVVYLGHDPDIDRPVAVKVVHAHLLEGEHGRAFLARFQQEATAAARCLHRNIITVFDYGVSQNNIPYIVMELVEGRELNRHLSEAPPLTIGESIGIVADVLDALDYAHRRGVIHRDIKPANIMVSPDLQVKVADFGVAHLDTSDLTGTGYVLGTPAYMSPEGARGRVTDERSDLYSAALVLLELLAGTRVRPVTDAPLADRVAAMLAGPLGPHPLRDALTSILCQALQEEPALRFASAAAMREALLGAGTLSQGMGDDYSRTEIMRVPPPRTLAAAGSPVSESLVSVLSTDSVAVVEQRLASYIGPLARILVKKALRSHRSTAEFSQALASHIPSQREREQFLRDISWLSRDSQLPGEVSQHAPGPSPEPSIGSVWDSVDRAALEEIGGLFSFYTGAIAQRLLKATARRTATVEQLVEQLAAYIPNPQERAAFLRAINQRRKR